MKPCRWLFWLWCAVPVFQGEQQCGWRWRWMQRLYNRTLVWDVKLHKPTELM